MRFPAGCGEPYLLFIRIATPHPHHFQHIHQAHSTKLTTKTEPPLLSQVTAVEIEVFLS